LLGLRTIGLTSCGRWFSVIDQVKQEVNFVEPEAEA
jgi:hypothetical protein